jgi:tRNA-dihydrouridine synthase A
VRSLHGDIERHLRFDRAEHPVALQLGGSDPAELAHCARLGSEWGYDEINLNCGCPSERVLHGSFGACLMREPELVAECVRAMRAASSAPISVKHRLGIDRVEDYDFVRRFVEIVAAAGCSIFIVHARNAVLRGLSPKENREVPPLRYEEVYRLKREFPELTIVINGGLQDWATVDSHLQQVDGAMLGRAAYHDSYLLAQTDCRAFGAGEAMPSREDVVEAMYRYACAETGRGTMLRAIARHMLGLFHGHPGARFVATAVIRRRHTRAQRCADAPLSPQGGAPILPRRPPEDRLSLSATASDRACNHQSRHHHRVTARLGHRRRQRKGMVVALKGVGRAGET